MLSKFVFFCYHLHVKDIFAEWIAFDYSRVCGLLYFVLYRVFSDLQLNLGFDIYHTSSYIHEF